VAALPTVLVMCTRAERTITSGVAPGRPNHRRRHVDLQRVASALCCRWALPT